MSIERIADALESLVNIESDGSKAVLERIAEALEAYVGDSSFDEGNNTIIK